MNLRPYRSALVAVGAAICFTLVLPPLRGIVAAASSSVAVVDDRNEGPTRQRAGLADSGWWAARMAFTGSSALGLGVLLTLAGTDRPRRRRSEGPAGPPVVGPAPVPGPPRKATLPTAEPPPQGGGRPDPFARLDRRLGTVPPPPPPPPRAGPDPGDLTPPRLSFGAFLGLLQELAQRPSLPPRLHHSLLESGGRSEAEVSELVRALRFFGLVDDERRPTAELRHLVGDLTPEAVRSLLERAYPGLMRVPPRSAREWPES